MECVGGVCLNCPVASMYCHWSLRLGIHTVRGNRGPVRGTEGPLTTTGPLLIAQKPLVIALVPLAVSIVGVRADL